MNSGMPSISEFSALSKSLLPVIIEFSLMNFVAIDKTFPSISSSDNLFKLIIPL